MKHYDILERERREHRDFESVNINHSAIGFWIFMAAQVVATFIVIALTYFA